MISNSRRSDRSGTDALVEDVATHPRMHGDRAGCTRIDRPGGPELGDVKDRYRRLPRLRREPGTLLAEEQNAVPGQVKGLDGLRTGQIVDTDDRDAGRAPFAGRDSGPVDQVFDAGVVILVLVAIGHHGAPTVPPALPDDVKGLRVEGVCRADH